MTTAAENKVLSAFERLIQSKADSLSDQELLSLDFMLHSAWRRKQSGARVEMLGAEWEQPDFADAHSKVLEEMGKRKFQHAGINGMDKKGPPVNEPSAKEIKKAEESDAGSGVAALPPEVPAEPRIEKGLIAKKEIHEFPNVVFDEGGAVDFVRKGKV